jgi:lipopolysaccharide export system permease protein
MLNIRQLNYFIDSIGRSIHDSRANLSGQFANNYKAYQLMDSTDRLQPDTIPVTHPEFLENFNAEEKAIIVSNALVSARNLKKSVEYHVQSMKSRSENLIKPKVVWHRKFTLSFACLVLFFIGAPLGAIIRKGGLGLPAVVSILFFILYHVISMIGEKSALKGAMEPSTGMWLSSVILLPLGIFLTLKATTDSPLMDMDLWNKLIGRESWIKIARKLSFGRFSPRSRS